MLGTPAAEAQLMTDLLALRDDPVGFVAYAYPWGQPGTPFEKFSGPRPWQLEELSLIGEHVRRQTFAEENELPLQVWRAAYSSGRGPGKSALFGMLAHWHMSTRIGAPTIVAANTETQMRTKTFPEFAVWFGAAVNAHWFTIETLRITPAAWLLDLARRRPEQGGLGIDPKYWYVAAQNWNADQPDAFAGAHNPYGMMVLFDEASGIPAPVWDVTRGFFTEVNAYRFHFAASQMRSRKGRFFEIFNDPKIGAEWRARTISTRNMPGIDQSEIRASIETYGEDSDYVRVEIDGLPPQTADDQFISADAVRAAKQNAFPPDYGEPLILGVDPAPRGRTAWYFRQGRNARDACGPATRGAWLGYDNVQIAAEVEALDRKYQPDAICIDFGMGTGVIDILKRKPWIRRKLHEVKFGEAPHDKKGEFGSHAGELWGRVRDWLPGGMLPHDDGSRGTLSDQLLNRGWKWSGREEGRKVLEAKEDLRARGVASPDDADALACTFEVNPPRTDRQPRGAARTQVADGVSRSMTD